MSYIYNVSGPGKYLAAGIVVAAILMLGFNHAAQAQAPAPAATGPVTVVVSFRIKAGKEADAIALVTDLTAKVKENETGVIAYVAHRDTADPMKITFIEIYKDQAAVAAHRNDPALQAALPKFGEIFEPGAPEIKSLTRVAGFTHES